MKKKLTGRPVLKTGRRDKKIDARFTVEEFQLILDMEKQLGMRRTDIIRLRVLNNAKNIVVNAGQFITQLDSIGTEMGRTGNNINQLARYANTLNKQGVLSSVIAERFTKLLEEYNKIQMQLEITLRRIIREMGK